MEHDKPSSTLQTIHKDAVGSFNNELDDILAGFLTNGVARGRITLLVHKHDPLTTQIAIDGVVKAAVTQQITMNGPKASITTTVYRF